MPILVILVIAVILILSYIGLYNACIRGRQKVDEAWSDIDVQLKRRLDLIPNLINTVKGYAEHEKDLLQKITDQRSRAIRAPAGNSGERIQAENMLTQGLRSVFAVAENYPDLKANINFLELQKQLAETEDQISSARRIYNGNAGTYNSTIASFPAAIVASMHGFQKTTFFKMDAVEAARAAKTPVVNF